MRNMNINDNEEEKSVRINALIDVGSDLSDDEDSVTQASAKDQKSEYQVRKSFVSRLTIYKLLKESYLIKTAIES